MFEGDKYAKLLVKDIWNIGPTDGEEELTFGNHDGTVAKKHDNRRASGKFYAATGGHGGRRNDLLPLRSHASVALPGKRYEGHVVASQKIRNYDNGSYLAEGDSDSGGDEEMRSPEDFLIGGGENFDELRSHSKAGGRDDDDSSFSEYDEPQIIEPELKNGKKRKLKKGKKDVSDTDFPEFDEFQVVEFDETESGTKKTKKGKKSSANDPPNKNQKNSTASADTTGGKHDGGGRSLDITQKGSRQFQLIETSDKAHEALEFRKAKEVQQQMEIWASLLAMRIKLQSIITSDAVTTILSNDINRVDEDDRFMFPMPSAKKAKVTNSLNAEKSPPSTATLGSLDAVKREAAVTFVTTRRALRSMATCNIELSNALTAAQRVPVDIIESTHNITKSREEDDMLHIDSAATRSDDITTDADCRGVASSPYDWVGPDGIEGEKLTAWRLHDWKQSNSTSGELTSWTKFDRESRPITDWCMKSADFLKAETTLEVRKSFKALDQSISGQIQAFLRSQQLRRFLKKNTRVVVPNTAESKEDTEADHNHHNGSSNNAEAQSDIQQLLRNGSNHVTPDVSRKRPAERLDVIFDDTEFYLQLLREVVDKPMGSNYESSTRLYSQQLKAYRMQRKDASKSGRRASKGRKLRYTPIPKLESFMIPQPRNSSTSLLLPATRDPDAVALMIKSLFALPTD